MADFLLELLSEEIPARMQAKAREDLARLFSHRIGEAGLTAQAVETLATPRRLVLIARGLPLQTDAVEEERKGPRADAPSQAIEGFLKSTGLGRDQLEEREDRKGGAVLFARIVKPGRATAELLAEIVPAVMREFPWPKSMRWGGDSISTASMRWVRPLQGIVALLGEEIVEFEIAGLRSGAATVGHRFHHPGKITIGSAGDYAEKLRACHVIVDQNERAQIIRDGAGAAAAAAGLKIVSDEGLVAENAGLAEWPVPLLGSFDPAFLAVPREVIQLTMRTNQKYFSCVDASGALAANFVCTANIEAVDGGEAIVAGNRKVLAARLSDAKFFWEQDLKIPLADQARKLGDIVFHAKLGTIAEKTDRMARLAGWLAGTGKLGAADPGEAEEAARLAKADLVTGMVGEFPELQGTIGGYLTRAQGLPGGVADAVRDHYKPVGQGDDVPGDTLTIAVSLADKVDSLACFWSIDEKPSGSKDPYALRRAALGVLQLIVGNGLRLSLTEVFDFALALSGHSASETTRRPGFSSPRNALAFDLLDFFADRLKVQQREAGVRHDLIDAIFSLGGEDDVVRLLARVRALQGFVETEDGADLLTGYRRAANILRKEDWGDEAGSASTYEVEPEEAALIAALDAAAPKADAAIAAEDFQGAMAVLASLRAPVDAFFEKVTVNDADPVKRAARLALLARMRNAVHQVADFSKIEG
jgi:glycyl-tRNA synthetase beta chain